MPPGQKLHVIYFLVSLVSIRIFKLFIKPLLNHRKFIGKCAGFLMLPEHCVAGTSLQEFGR